VAKPNRLAVLSFTMFGWLAIAGTFWKAFVVECLWNWFATEPLHVSPLSYLQAVGICMLIYLFKSHVGDTDEKNEERWKKLMVYVDASVPGENRQELRFALKKQGIKTDQDEDIEPFVAITIEVLKALGDPVRATIILGIAFGIHTIM